MRKNRTDPRETFIKDQVDEEEMPWDYRHYPLRLREREGDGRPTVMANTRPPLPPTDQLRCDGL